MSMSYSILSSHCIYVFLKIFTTNGHYFPLSALTGGWSLMETDCYLQDKYKKCLHSTETNVAPERVA